jgi:hypothetical protein
MRGRITGLLGIRCPGKASANLGARLPDGENAAWAITLDRPTVRKVANNLRATASAPVEDFPQQDRRVQVPEASMRPSGEKARHSSSPRWPTNCWSFSPVAVRQRQTIGSSAPLLLANNLPLGEKARTPHLAGPGNSRRFLPVATSQNSMTCLSRPASWRGCLPVPSAQTRVLPSSRNARLLAAGVSRRCSLPVATSQRLTPWQCPPCSPGSAGAGCR